MTLSNKTYNVIKWLITVFLPAVGASYWAMIEVWDFPRVTGVNGTINAIIAFLGLLIAYSTNKYRKSEKAFDGELIITQSDGVKYLALGVDRSLDEVTGKNTVHLNVVDKSNSTK